MFLHGYLKDHQTHFIALIQKEFINNVAELISYYTKILAKDTKGEN
jgi:hypothetical protein